MQTSKTLLLFCLAIIFALGTFASPLSAQTVFYVDSSNTAGGNGTPGSPYATVSEAITAASTGDTIKVAAGTYREYILVQDKTVHLLGSFSTDFALRNPQAGTSHLQGDSTDAVVTLLNAGATTIDGFRISGGTRSTIQEFGDLGGGLYIEGGSPTISNNIIENNDTRDPLSQNNDVVGGGIYAGEAAVTILSNIIRNNIAGRGAGIGINGGTAVIRNNLIQGNVAVHDHGGGLYIDAPSVEITGNRIERNEVGRSLGYGWGGGILIFNVGSFATLSRNIITDNYAPSIGSGVFIDDGAEAVLEHELIYRNQCTSDGGVAVYVDGAGEGGTDDPGSRVTLRHCTIVNNNCGAPLPGSGLFVEGNSDVVVENCIFWGNGGDDVAVDSSSQLVVTYTNSEETVPGPGNTSLDPLFADSDNDDYHLRSSAGRWDPAGDSGNGAWVLDTETSPCIDAANPASSYANETPPNGGRANMGAYGNTSEASRSATTGAERSDQEIVSGFTMFQNFPNPFNPTTRIPFTLHSLRFTTLMIYNQLGQEVAVLVNEELQPGSYEVVWDATGFPSGIYLWRLRAGEFVQSKAMVLIR